MAQTTPKMQLTIWNLATDLYNYEALAGNFIKIDQHDHGSSGGSQIDGSVAIKDGSIGVHQLAPNSVTGNAIADNSIDATTIQDGSITTGKIGDYQVTTPKIAPRSITAEKIAAGVITTQQLAEDVLPQRVESLPYFTDVPDGFEVYYQPSTGDGATDVVWHLRLNSTEQRWEFIGGPPKMVLQVEKKSNTKDLPGGNGIDDAWRTVNGCKIVLPAGKYAVNISAQMWSYALSTATGKPEVQLGFNPEEANVNWSYPRTVGGRDSIPSANKIGRAIVTDDEPYSVPVQHESLVSISSAKPSLRLYARRTSTAVEGATANTISGYIRKGRLSVTPLYLNVS